MAKSKKKQQDNKIVILTVLIAITALLIGYFGRMLYENRQDTKATSVASDVVNNLITGEPAEAYKLTTGELQENQSEEDFVASMSGLKAEDPYMLDPVILKGDGRIMYERYVENLPENDYGATSGSFQVTLVKEGNNWRASNIVVR